MHLHDDVDIDLPSALVVSSSSAEGYTRPARPRTESPARSITFNLNPTGI